jgi:large subunit ribosomal protein L21
MFAVIKTGGKQYCVSEGETLNVEKISGEPGAEVNFDVLLVADHEGKEVSVGTLKLNRVATAKILEHGKGEKVNVIKFKSKVRYKRNVGHRQPFTKVQITKI